jgi:hypothetical protein
VVHERAKTEALRLYGRFSIELDKKDIVLLFRKKGITPTTRMRVAPVLASVPLTLGNAVLVETRGVMCAAEFGGINTPSWLGKAVTKTFKNGICYTGTVVDFVELRTCWKFVVLFNDNQKHTFTFLELRVILDEEIDHDHDIQTAAHIISSFTRHLLEPCVGCDTRLKGCNARLASVQALSELADKAFKGALLPKLNFSQRLTFDDMYS